MSQDKPSLGPPPALGRPATAAPRAATGSGAGSPPAPGAPRVNVGVAPPARGAASAKPGAAPPSAEGAARPGPPALAIGSGAGRDRPGAGSAPAAPSKAPSQAPAAGLRRPAAGPQGRPGRGPRAATPDPRRTPAGRAEIPAGHTVQGLRPPTGAVRSDPAAAEVVRAARALADLLVEENAALRRHDVDAVRALADRKEATTRLYRERMLAVHKDPGHLTGLPEGERAVVRQTGVYLDAHLAENARLLKATMEGTNRLMSLIVDAVKHVNAERAPGYAADGRMSDPTHNPSRVTMAYNENL